MREIDLGLTDVSRGGPKVLDIEYADDGLGCKIVFSSIAEGFRNPVATFETGSFLDKGGVADASPKHDICVSTAGGCTRSCTFCAVPNSPLGFERLLTADEILQQVTTAVDLRNPNGDIPNVVGVMGNGEPADNSTNLIIAMNSLMQGTTPIDRITISTIGENGRGINAMADAFKDAKSPVKLQFSLHAADEEKRRVLVPGRRSLAAIMADVDRYAEVTGIPVKFNVVLMEKDGFTNASPQDAAAVADLLTRPSFHSGNPIGRRLKLSAYNPIPGSEFRAPSKAARDAYVGVLQAKGISDIKTFRGSGIDIDPTTGKGGFACGQLRATTHIQRQ